MKYIDADKLIAEIEKRMSENCELGKKAECFSHRAVEDNDILAIIDSLQQEQPEVDLENYLVGYFKGWFVDEDLGLVKPDGWSCIVDDLKGIARHFYELGLNARK